MACHSRTRRTPFLLLPFLLFSLLFVAVPLSAQNKYNIPDAIHLRIVKAEDERNWSDDLAKLFSHTEPGVRRRAALAAGRIGNAASVPTLASLLSSDPDEDVRVMAAFALGETESEPALRALLGALRFDPPVPLQARIIEGIGKCAAAMPSADDSLRNSIADAVLGALDSEHKRVPQPNREIVLFALTAALRAKPAGAGRSIAPFLSSPDARIRADAANSIARLRLKDANEPLLRLLDSDPDPIVRANAARALGAAESSASADTLLKRAVSDPDPGVRVSSIRSLATIKDHRAADPLISRAEILLAEARNRTNPGKASPRLLAWPDPFGGSFQAAESNELLDLASTLGQLLAGTEDERALRLLAGFRELRQYSDPEVEIAFAKISPTGYLGARPFDSVLSSAQDKRVLACKQCTRATAIGLGELGRAISTLPVEKRTLLGKSALRVLIGQIDSRTDSARFDEMTLQVLAVPDALRASSVLAPDDLRALLFAALKARGLFIRATAAELLGNLPPSILIREALVDALHIAMQDQNNDAKLAILVALAKQKTSEAYAAIKTAVTAPDYIVRRRAIALLEEAGQADATMTAEPVKSRNTMINVQRALARIGKSVEADVKTDRGTFTIELLPNDAPLTVDNFVQLAKKKFFNGIAFHRVVPNFVIQSGDPIGTGSGGPGYQIRCEINMVPYDRGALGMALSGKDTGGSQWFVTHSPQPHLDGGYTVFGRVITGMEVVDQITRGDRILRIKIRESPRSRGR